MSRPNAVRAQKMVRQGALVTMNPPRTGAIMGASPPMA